MVTYLLKELHLQNMSISIFVAVNAIVIFFTTVFIGKLISSTLKKKKKLVVNVLALVSSFLLLILAINSNQIIIITFPHNLFVSKNLGLAFSIIALATTFAGYVSNKVIATLLNLSGSFSLSFIFMAVSIFLCGIIISLVKENRTNS